MNFVRGQVRQLFLEGYADRPVELSFVSHFLPLFFFVPA
jgi:hypothetical protein